MLLIRAGRLARLTLFLALLVVGLAVVVLVTIQTAWFKDWLRGYVSAEARRFLNGELAIGRLDGNLLTGIELENVSVRRNGEALVSVKNLGIDYSIIDLVSSGLMLDDIRITQPHILLRRTKDGWSLGQLLKSEASEADREGPGRPVRIGSIGISDGSVTIEEETASPGTLPRHITRLDFKGGFAYEPVDFTLDVAHLSFRAEEPGLSLNSLSGRLATRGDDVHVERLAMRTAESSLALSGVIRNYQKTPVVQAKLTSDKTTLRELGAFVPALSSITLQPAYEISVDGPLDALKAELSVRSKAGQVTANVVADVQSERPRLQGTAEALHVRLEEAAPTLPASHVTGRATFDIAGRDAATLVGTLNVQMAASQVAGYRAEAIKASARVKGRQTHVDATARGYGASLSAQGIVDLPASSDGSPTIDLKGRAANVDFARLPRALGVPSLRTRLGGTYHVTSAGARTGGDVVLTRSSVEGATIIEGTKISGRLDGKRFTAEATGGVEGVDPARVSRALRTQTRGQAAPVDDRLAGASVASATFDLTASGRIGGSISGEARVDVAEARGLDGTLRDVVLHARVQEGAGSGSVAGVFEGLNPGRATGRRDLVGSLSGTLEARAAVPDWHNVAVETVAGSTRLDLTASKAGLVSVERGTLRASASNGMLEVQQLELRSNIADVDASGRVGLAGSATSTLGYKVTVNDAGAAARLAGVADVSGTGTIEGQITGTRADLATTGTLTATRFLYGQTAEVVSTAAEYEVAVPDLNLANVRANVKGHANLVKASGVDVEAIELQARYADRGLDFDTTVRQGDRRLAGSGHIELPPDAVHVRLDTLAITAPDVDWRLTAPSRIHYAGPRLTVSPFAMRGGDQTVSVAGTLSVGADASSASVAPDAPLTLRATSIDLAAVDRLAGTKRGLQGRLDADLTASGTLDAPVVDGTLAVRDGAVDTFKFERFTTTIEAGERKTNVTARLDQRPGTWLDAKATLPAVSTLRTGKAGTTPIDATLTTSPIDLGLVQSFTAAVREVTGTLEANVRVSGTIETPSVEGQVRVQNGAFTVAAFDTPFKGLDAHVAMKGSQIDIQSLRVLDADGKPLAISGALTLPGARAATADLRIKADDFSLMNGKLGELEVDTDLHMRGTLGEQVRVDGEVAVHQGRLEVDRLFEQFGSSAYSTEPGATLDTKKPPVGRETPSAATPEPPPKPDQPARPGEILDSVVADVRLRVPNNLVLRGDNLQMGSGGLGLGDLNITVGGDVRATKPAAGRLVLVGSIRTVRGFYEFQGRRFEVLRDGSIGFKGPDPTDPTLDITALREISGVDAIVRVSGTAQRPELELSSRPPLDEADVLSLIVFNRPINELGEGERTTLAHRAGAMLGGAVTGPVAEALRDALDLDLLEISPVGEGSGGSPSVTVGNQVGERVFIKVRQQLGSSSASALLLEYELNKLLRLQTNVTEGETDRSSTRRAERGGVDLIFVVRY